MRKTASALCIVLAALVGSAGTGGAPAPAAAADAPAVADTDGPDGRSVFLVYSTDERSELVPCG
jgi:hypothetical protein